MMLTYGSAFDILIIQDTKNEVYYEKIYYGTRPRNN